MGSSGKWLQSEVPWSGWTCVSLEITGDELEVCEMCEREEIRFVQVMQHPGYPHDLRCGCICAGRMSEDIDAARRRDEWMHSASSRRGRWLSRKWKWPTENWTTLKANKFRISLMRDKHDQRWSGEVTDTLTREVFVLPETFDALDNARLAAFDAMLLLEYRRAHPVAGTAR